MVALLLSRGAEVNVLGGTDNTAALHLAVSHGHASTVLLLLENGADPNIRCTNSMAFGTPLEIARGIGNDEIVQSLLDHGAK